MKKLLFGIILILFISSICFGNETINDEFTEYVKQMEIDATLRFDVYLYQNYTTEEIINMSSKVYVNELFDFYIRDLKEKQCDLNEKYNNGVKNLENLRIEILSNINNEKEKK